MDENNGDKEIKLDAKDRKILSELDMNARESMSQIAKKVRLSKETVNYRIKQMEEKGIISGYYTAIDLSKLSYIFYRVWLRFQNTTEEKEREIMNFCKKHPSIGWVYTVDGAYDIVFAVYAKSIHEIENFCDEFAGKYGIYISDRMTSIATKIWHFKHNYLYGTKDFKEVLLGEEAKVKIDEQDFKLLKLLAQNARLSVVDVSRKLGLSPNTIKYRIKNLMQNKVIIAFRADININTLGYEHYKVFLQLQNLDKQKFDGLVNFFRKNENVIYITKPLSPADLEFEIILKNEKELHVFLRELRSRFDVIKNYQHVLLYNEVALNYLP